MTINGREVIAINYSTEANWLKDIPKKKWLCILVNNNRERRYLEEIISKIVDHDVCYVCTVGEGCELTHDLVDEEISFKEAEIENRHLPKHLIITTWHQDFQEGFWFAFHAARHEEVEIE